MQVAGTTLNEIVKATESTNVAFVKECYEFKKIRDRQHEPNFNNVVGLMVTKISALAGVNNEIDMATKSDLLRFIKTRCTDITLEEIYKAFELERYNEYPEKSKHFQLFGTEYFSEVIKKYRVWKTQLKIQKNITREDNTPLLPSISDSQKEEILINGDELKFVLSYDMVDDYDYELYMIYHKNLSSLLKRLNQLEDTIHNKT
jgi:hypothetical protein